MSITSVLVFDEVGKDDILGLVVLPKIPQNGHTLWVKCNKDFLTWANMDTDILGLLSFSPLNYTPFSIYLFLK